MTGFYILGGLLLLLLIILLPRVKLIFDIGEDRVIHLKYGFIRIKRRLKRGLKKAVNTADKAGDAKKKSPKITTKDVLHIIRNASRPVRYLLSRVKLLHLSVNIVVGGADAAQTAIDYGRVSAYVHGSIAAVSNIIFVQADQIDIRPDFLNEHTDFHIHGILCVRGYMFLWALIKFFFIYTKEVSNNNIQGKRRMQNGRTFTNPGTSGDIDGKNPGNGGC